jgi:hypothetical protein
MSSLANQVEAEGFAFLAGYEEGRSAASILNGIGQADTLGNEGPTHQLKPASVESQPPNTYSGNYGLGIFPLHTDMAQWHIPPRFLMLRCVQGSNTVPTMLVDGTPILREIGKTVLTRALVRPRRTVRGRRLLLRLCDYDDSGGIILRWDEKFILPASPAGKFGMEQLRAALAIATQQFVYLTNPGDTLIVDNWRMLHGRGSVPTEALDRTVARAYLRSIHLP